MVSAQLFFMTAAGTLATVICGWLSNYFGAPSNPIMYGRILACMTTFAELLSIPFFWLAGKAYVEHVKSE
jgi:MFS-type transporter involved in bile tolerance (Atg22 family)